MFLLLATKYVLSFFNVNVFEYQSMVIKHNNLGIESYQIRTRYVEGVFQVHMVTVLGNG